MCGLVGMISSNDVGFNITQKNIFSQLLWADTLRGDDSTGVFGVNKYGNLDYLKEKGNAGELMDSKEYRAFEDNIFSDYRFVVGHNRKATRGWVTDDNAHPFVEESIALIHNGTLQNHDKLTKEIVQVDSHAILHSIVERGYEKTLKEVEGAFALSWYDAKDKTLRLIRNEQRPLFIASTVGAWYFASEKGMLEWILGRENEDIKEITECKPGTMYFFKLEDNKNMWYQPLKLYSPPKAKTTALTIVPPKEVSKEENTPFPYSNTDFIIGTKILILGSQVQPLKKVRKNEYDALFFGYWYGDELVEVKTWATDAEVVAVEDSQDWEDDGELIYQATISAVVSKKGKISLICKTPVPYVPVYGQDKKEQLPDEFMFTDAKCSHCSKEVTFDDMQEGIFKYATQEDYEIVCKDCYAKGAHLVV